MSIAWLLRVVTWLGRQQDVCATVATAVPASALPAQGITQSKGRVMHPYHVPGNPERRQAEILAECAHERRVQQAALPSGQPAANRDALWVVTLVVVTLIEAALVAMLRP